MVGKHLVEHVQHPELVSDSTLHVIVPISNTSRYQSRLRLFRECEERMLRHRNLRLYTVEVAFADRHHEVTVGDNPQHLMLRTKSEIWCKEASINLAVRYLLPRDAKYICWSDGDVEFRNENWALETLHQLQHFDVVQPWQDALDLGPTGNVMQSFKSFGFLRQSQPNVPLQTRATQPYPYGHSGFAWACTRRFWEATRGLLDYAILGSADHHMAHGMIGNGASTVHGDLGPSYVQGVLDWQRRATRITHGQVGFVQGRIEHHFHGSKRSRGYQTRWQILVDHKFDPVEDTCYDEQGLIQLAGKPDLEAAVRHYNRSRNEDGVDE